MTRAMFGLVSIVCAIAIVIWCYGYSTPDITTMMPGLNRTVTRTVDLETAAASQHSQLPDELRSTRNANSSAPSAATPTPTSASTPEPAVYTAPASDSSSPRTAEVINPDTTAYLNPDHVRPVEQPTPTANGAQGFVAPNPLPAQPHWIWNVQDREFNDVVVTHVDADLVTITSSTGPAQIEIATLPMELRQALHYNPVLAAQAAAARKNSAAVVSP